MCISQYTLSLVPYRSNHSLRLMLTWLLLLRKSFTDCVPMKSYQIGRDVILRCHIANVRISGIFASRIIRDVSERWNMRVDSMPSQLWGQYMAGTAMLGSFCKGEERIRLTLRSSDVSDLYVEAMALGEVSLPWIDHRKLFISLLFVRFEEASWPIKVQQFMKFQVDHTLFGWHE